MQIGQDINPFLSDNFDLIQKEIFNQNNSNTYCSIGTIVAINSSPVSVDVQPSIKYFDKIEGFKTPQVLRSVPLMQIQNSIASVRFPLNLGDVGMILRTSREVFTWLDSTGGFAEDPDSGNLYNDNAVIFIPFIQKFSNALSVKNLGIDIVSSEVSLLTQLLTLTQALTTFSTTVAAASNVAQIAAAALTLQTSLTPITTNFTQFKGEQ